MARTGTATDPLTTPLAATALSAHASSSDPQPAATPIHELPDDCLIDIISNEPKCTDDRERDILNISHVCRRWRLVALAIPNLWSEVPRMNTKWTELCLERTGNSLLDICADSEEWIRRIPAIYSALRHMERVRSIRFLLQDLCYSVKHPDDLEDIKAARDEILKELVVREAPNLRSLYLGFEGSYGSDYDSPPESLPDNLFGGKLIPQLNDMTLQFCTVPSPIFTRLLSTATALTNLHLHDVHLWDSMEEMVPCLSAAPCLRSLYWSDRGTYEVSSFAPKRSHVHQPRCVRLDNLVELRLEGSHTQNMVIFSYLSVPTTTRINIDSSNTMSHDTITDEEVEDLTALFAEALEGHFAAASANGASFDSIWFDDLGGVGNGEGLSYPSTTIQSEPSSASGLLPDELAIRRYWAPSTSRERWGRGGQYGRRFTEAWLSVPVFNRALSIPYDPSLPHAMLYRFEKAREVRIGGNVRLREFCTKVLNVHGPCALPALERLRLERVDLSDFGGELFDALRAGAPIRELVVAQSEFEEAIFNALETLLGAGAIQWERKDSLVNGS